MNEPISPVDALEALLFVSDSPQPLASLARAMDLTEGQTEQALELLEERMNERGSLTLMKIAGGYQLATKPFFSDLIANFLRPQRQKLRRNLLEVLAVVAYRQPVTVGDIEKVRGVQSDHVVRTLVERRLLRECGRKKAPGRPFLYATTQEFLHQFGLKSLDDLPPIDRESSQGALFGHEPAEVD
ncbi:MAG TPA: SMC-Scp complex subunit ScpB [Fimbriimonadaceae bacterium]|nr:SMC-Scp complex subunit ScpB [Fimbriimonadaceae bacterium]